jgi:hypothetical protein
MATKFGSLAERLIGAVVFFVPDGTQLAAGPPPVVSGKLIKPATLVDWEDFNIGRINQSAYDPVTEERTRDSFSYARKKYIRDTKNIVMADAFNNTLIDYPATLFDRLMYGLASTPVADSPQAIFARNVREDLGWVKMLRYTEDGAVLCDAEFRVRLSIQENPPDSFEPGSPVLRIQHLGDTDAELEIITFNPAPEEEEEEEA